MQVGTTSPQVVFMDTGALGHWGRSQWQGLALQLDLQFQVPVYLLHLGIPKASVLGLSRLVQTPDSFTCQDYLGTQVESASVCVCFLLLVVPGHDRSLNGGRADRRTDRLIEPTAATYLSTSFTTPPSITPSSSPRVSSVVAVVVSIDRGVLFFCALNLCFCSPHPRPLPRPSPSPTHIPADLASYSASAQEAVIYGPYL